MVTPRLRGLRAHGATQAGGVTPFLRALMDVGVLALPAGRRVLRLLPPLVVSEEELTTVCDAIEDVLTS